MPLRTGGNDARLPRLPAIVNDVVALARADDATGFRKDEMARCNVPVILFAERDGACQMALGNSSETQQQWQMAAGLMMEPRFSQWPCK
jgi:hypothetical protein